MTKNDLTIQILQQIRDEIRQTNQRLDQTREEYSRRITESEIRTASGITAVNGTLSEIKQLLVDRLDMRDRVEKCEIEIERLKSRVP